MGKEPRIPRDLKDVTGLSELERRQLAEILETRDASQAASGRRSARRFSMRHKDVVVTLGEGSASQVIRAPVRDLSDGGLSFFYGVFVYPQTSCVVRLMTIDGEQVLVPAVIVRCSLIKGRIHEVGVRFKSPIDSTMFISEAAAERAMLLSVDTQWLKLQESLEKLRAAFVTRDLDTVRKCAGEILQHAAVEQAA